MGMSKLKEQVLEIAEIAKQCPENLQALCFEMLLRDLLEGREVKKPKATMEKAEQKAAEPEDAEQTGQKTQVEKSAGNQDDISETELHTKTRHFLKKYGVTIEELNNLFYKEGDRFETLYEDLKTTKMAEAQMRIAMLQSLKSALSTGDFEATVANVRSEAMTRKCIDTANFARNFQNNGALYDFQTYDKTTTTVRLSEEGKKALAALIKQLQ
jgi:hypothetical protein